jgi:hypothetical protein
MDVRLAMLKAVPFYFLHDASTLNQCRHVAIIKQNLCVRTLNVAQYHVEEPTHMKYIHIMNQHDALFFTLFHNCLWAWIEGTAVPSIQWFRWSSG